MIYALIDYFTVAVSLALLFINSYMVYRHIRKKREDLAAHAEPAGTQAEPLNEESSWEWGLLKDYYKWATWLDWGRADLAQQLKMADDIWKRGAALCFWVIVFVFFTGLSALVPLWLPNAARTTDLGITKPGFYSVTAISILAPLAWAAIYLLTRHRGAGWACAVCCIVAWACASLAALYYHLY